MIHIFSILRFKPSWQCFPKKLMAICPRSIRNQAFFFLITPMALSLVVLWILLLNTGKHAIKTTVLRDYSHMAIHSTGEIGQFVEGTKNVLEVAALTIGTLRSDPWRQKIVISNLTTMNPIFQHIVSVDLSGQEVATSQLGVPLRDRSQEEAFLKAKAGSFYTSEVKISKNYIPMMTLSMPIHQLGKISGVLIAEINLRGIWSVIDSLTFGQTGKAFLVDHRRRQLIAHPDKSLVLKNMIPMHPDLIEEILSGQIEDGRVIDREGQAWLIASAPIESLGWTLVIFQSEREAYAFSQVANRQSWAIMILSIFGVVLMSRLLSQWLHKGMRLITESMHRIADGDFTTSFRIFRKDEIGWFLFSFKQVIRQLRRNQDLHNRAAIGETATYIGHRLKSSLITMNSHVRTLAKYYRNKQLLQESADVLARQLELWEKLLYEMGQMAKSPYKPKVPINVNPIAQNVAASFQLSFAQKGIDVNLQLYNDLLVILGDEDKLKEILSTLLANALEAMPPGGRIHITTNRRDNIRWKHLAFAEIKVTNSGKGIPAEDLVKIFEPFRTTKSKGWGIGLFMSKEMVRQLGGQIEVTSEPNQETTFTIKIPEYKDRRSDNDS